MLAVEDLILPTGNQSCSDPDDWESYAFIRNDGSRRSSLELV